MKAKLSVVDAQLDSLGLDPEPEIINFYFQLQHVSSAYKNPGNDIVLNLSGEVYVLEWDEKLWARIVEHLERY